MAEVEWPKTLQVSDYNDPAHEQYQADRGSNKDLPGGSQQHERRTRAYRKLLEKVAS